MTMITKIETPAATARTRACVDLTDHAILVDAAIPPLPLETLVAAQWADRVYRRCLEQYGETLRGLVGQVDKSAAVCWAEAADIVLGCLGAVDMIDGTLV